MADEVNKVARFLADTVTGKALYTDELVYSLEDGAVEGVYSDQMTFANLAHSDSMVSFDLFVVSNEKLYVVRGDDRRSSLRKDFSGAAVFRYELALRRSSGQLTGHMRFVSATGNAVPAEAMVSRVVNLRFLGGELVWREEETVYRDQPKADGGFAAVAFEADCRLYVDEGKVRYEYRGVCLDVDPDDFSRRLSSAVFPVFLAKER